MSHASDCSCSICEPVVTLVPGSPAEPCTPCADGAPGVNPYTSTSAAITLPAVAGPVAVASSFGNTSWMGIGQVIFISDGTNWAHFRVLTIPSSTSATLEWLDYADDAAGTTVIATAASVSPSGTQPALAAALPNAITFSAMSSAVASDTVAAGVGISTLVHPLTSLATGLGVLAIDLLTNYVPGYRFKIIKCDWVTTVAGTGAGATQTFNMEIGVTNVTHTLTVTLASTATIGAVTAGVPNPIVAANVGTATDTFSIEMAAGGTVFTAGAGYFLVEIANLDTQDAIASLSDHVNDILLSLA